MRLKIDLSTLKQLANRFNPEGSNFIIDSSFQSRPIDEVLDAGDTEVPLSEISTDFNLLSYHGRQILLYIKDHTGKFDATLQNSESGNRFHVAFCTTLQTMWSNNRSTRYVPTNNLSGQFLIQDSPWSGYSREQRTKLNVCKYCIQKLNYQGSRDYRKRQQTFNTFSLTEFFTDYSTCFDFVPKGLSETANVGYTPDWPDISSELRRRAGFRCSKCTVDLSQHKYLCDVHHINGSKADNRQENLMVLCRDCHRKQPKHGGIFLKRHEMQIITQLRNAIPATSKTGWTEAYQYADKAIHGDLGVLQSMGYSVPIIGYEYIGGSGAVEVDQLEAAWPGRKEAISLTKVDIPGWTVHLVGSICGGL